MTRKEAVLEEVELLPEEQLDQVLTFIRQLRLKGQETLDTAAASEAVLSIDWLSQEEETAWQDL